MTQDVSVGDKVFTLFLEETEIKARVKDLANTLDGLYAGKNPLLICILNGAFIFGADLIRSMSIDAEIQFVRISSYGAGMESTGKVRKMLNLEADIKGRHIILVEDIVDTGNTLEWLRDYFVEKEPASVSMACLLYKEEAFIKDTPPEHFCFNIPNKFVVGYGLDYAEFGRGLGAIYQLKS